MSDESVKHFPPVLNFPLLNTEDNEANASEEGPREENILIIKGKATDSKNNQIEELVKSNINPRRRGIIIRNTRLIHGGMLVECANAVEAQKLIREIENQPQLTSVVNIKTTSKRLPKVIFYNIPENINNDEIVKAIQVTSGEKSEARYKFSIRKNKSSEHRVFDIQGRTLSILEKIGSVNLNWITLKLKEFIPTRKCNKCQSFQHTAHQCKEERLFCGRCCGNHFTYTCNYKFKKCINCHTLNMQEGRELEVHHTTTDPDCFCNKAITKRYRNSITY